MSYEARLQDIMAWDADEQARVDRDIMAMPDGTDRDTLRRQLMAPIEARRLRALDAAKRLGDTGDLGVVSQGDYRKIARETRQRLVKMRRNRNLTPEQQAQLTGSMEARLRMLRDSNPRLELDEPVATDPARFPKHIGDFLRAQGGFDPVPKIDFAGGPQAPAIPPPPVVPPGEAQSADPDIARAQQLQAIAGRQAERTQGMADRIGAMDPPPVLPPEQMDQLAQLSQPPPPSEITRAEPPPAGAPGSTLDGPPLPPELQEPGEPDPPLGSHESELKKNMATQIELLRADKEAYQEALPLLKELRGTLAGLDDAAFKDLRVIEESRRESTNRQVANMQEALTAFNEGKVDPSRAWESKSALEKVGLAFASMMVAFGSSLSGRGDPLAVNKMVERMIDRDIQQQRADIAKAGKRFQMERNMLSVLEKGFESQRLGLEAQRIMARGSLIQHLENQIASTKDEQLINSYDAAISQMRVTNAEALRTLTSTTTLEGLQRLNLEAKTRLLGAQTRKAEAEAGKIEGAPGALRRRAKFSNVKVTDPSKPIVEKDVEQMREISANNKIVMDGLQDLKNRVVRMAKDRGWIEGTLEKGWLQLQDLLAKGGIRIGAQSKEMAATKSLINQFKADYGTTLFKGALQEAELTLLNDIMGDPVAFWTGAMPAQLRAIGERTVRADNARLDTWGRRLDYAKGAYDFLGRDFWSLPDATISDNADLELERDE